MRPNIQGTHDAQNIPSRKTDKKTTCSAKKHYPASENLIFLYYNKYTREEIPQQIQSLHFH